MKKLNLINKRPSDEKLNDAYLKVKLQRYGVGIITVDEPEAVEPEPKKSVLDNLGIKARSPVMTLKKMRTEYDTGFFYCPYVPEFLKDETVKSDNCLMNEFEIQEFLENERTLLLEDIHVYEEMNNAKIMAEEEAAELFYPDSADFAQGWAETEALIQEALNLDVQEAARDFGKDLYKTFEASYKDYYPHELKIDTDGWDGKEASKFTEPEIFECIFSEPGTGRGSHVTELPKVFDPWPFVLHDMVTELNVECQCGEKVKLDFNSFKLELTSDAKLSCRSCGRAITVIPKVK